MKITIVGTGYVGLVTGACLSDTGIDVTCVDIDQNKINGLKNGILPIYEPGLEEIVKRNYNEGRLNFSIDLADAIRGSQAARVVPRRTGRERATSLVSDLHGPCEYTFHSGLSETYGRVAGAS